MMLKIQTSKRNKRETKIKSSKDYKKQTKALIGLLMNPIKRLMVRMEAPHILLSGAGTRAAMGSLKGFRMDQQNERNTREFPDFLQVYLDESRRKKIK